MAFTKIAAAGIGSTETVTLHSLEVLNNATVGGVLTYEDVTNVDSIGIITARAGVLVGSGITLSKDGDIFATGITTITGEVKLENHLRLVDNKNIYLGTGADLEIRSGGNDGVINQANADLKIQRGGSGKVTFKSTGSHFIDDVFVVDKIVHDGDTNTAIRFPADDKFTVETAGTERLAIEPAGNVNISKSVNVGAALTVGTSSSTSTLVDKGFIELTRSSGDTYIDFKNAFADDFDSRIITNQANQLQFFTGGQGNTKCALQTGTGKVAISTDTPPQTSAKLEIRSDKLGATSGNTQELLYMLSPDISNATSYRFTNYRHTNGTSHTSSEGRLRRHVDATDQGYFALGDGYASIGYGANERFRVSNDGYVTKSNHPCFRAGRNTTQTPGASGTIVFNYVSSPTHFNQGGHYDTSTGAFTAPIAGVYSFHTQVLFQNLSDGQNMADAIYIRYNSSGGASGGELISYDHRRAEYIASETGQAGYYSAHASVIVNMAQGGSVYIRNSRAGLEVHGNQNYTFFQGYLIG